MLRSTKDIQRHPIYATDGNVGDVEAFFFDDESWKVRYLVAKAGGLLLKRNVLIAPEFIEAVDRDVMTLYTDLTKEQVKNSPTIEADRPVADQQEIAYYDYYRINPYWGSGWQAPGFVGATAYAGPYPGVPNPAAESVEAKILREEQRGDPHLRSTKEVAGYYIRATDGEVGHVEDFIVDDEDWAIRYMVVDTRNWLPGRRVPISPRWISEISWRQREVYVDLTQDEIKSAPRWNSEAPLDREYETLLHEHYGRPPYWVYH